MTNLSVKLRQRFSGGPPYYASKANHQNFLELELVLATTSAKANGPTSREYSAEPLKFFRVSKVRVSPSDMCFKSVD